MKGAINRYVIRALRSRETDHGQYNLFFCVIRSRDCPDR